MAIVDDVREPLSCLGMDPKCHELETRIATLELMLVSERARPTPNQSDIEKLEKTVG